MMFARFEFGLDLYIRPLLEYDSDELMILPSREVLGTVDLGNGSLLHSEQAGLSVWSRCSCLVSFH